MIMNKKRLTIILGGFSVGGAQHMVYELLQSMDTDCFAVHVLCCEKRYNSVMERQLEKRYPITYLDQSGTVTPGTVLRVVRAIWKTKPDIVHAHLGGAGFGAIWALLCRKPLVVTVHTKPEKAFSGKIEKVIRMAIKMGKTKLVAVSQENAALVQAYYGQEQSAWVNNGIDLSRFRRDTHRDFTLINVARQDDNKNQAALIRCFARLHAQYPETRLLLLGNGVNHEKLKALAAELGISDAVTFTGNVANTQDYYAQSDLYVQCSFREAMPLSVLEAMAAGLPIVSTHVGGLADVVKDNGILVPAGEEDALYEAILSVYGQTPEKRVAMEQASLRLVQAYSSAGMAREYEKIYDEMCK